MIKKIFVLFIIVSLLGIIFSHILGQINRIKIENLELEVKILQEQVYYLAHTIDLLSEEKK